MTSVGAVLRAMAASLLAAADEADRLAVNTNSATTEHQAGDRWLTATEAARMTGLSARFFYERCRDLPFTVRPSPRRLRFSARGLAEYMRQRATGKGA